MKTSLALITLILLSACSKVTELDKRTESMEKATEKVSNDTVDVKATVGVTYQQLRSGNALNTRNEEFKKLMSEDEHVQIRTRIAAACGFFKAFEYQLWTDNDTFDDEHARSIMYLDAANEFTRRTADLYELIDTKKMSPTNQSRRHKDEQAFYSIAVALHMNHNFQDEVVRKNSQLQKNSMYSMMKNALLKEKNKQPLEEHEEVLVNGLNKEIMIELIKARVDIMTTLALGNLTDKRDMNLGQKTQAAIFKITRGRFGRINLPENYNNMNEVTKNFTEDYLSEALNAKGFLREIGITKSLEKTLRSAMKEIDFDEKKLSKEEKKNLPPQASKEHIRNMINQLLETR